MTERLHASKKMDQRGNEFTNELTLLLRWKWKKTYTKAPKDAQYISLLGTDQFTESRDWQRNEYLWVCAENLKHLSWIYPMCYDHGSDGYYTGTNRQVGWSRIISTVIIINAAGSGCE